MRKNVKNDKVLKAITIGLAAMIAATSVPVTVLADDTTNEGENSKSEPTPCENAESESSKTESSCETAENTYVDTVQTIVADAPAETPAETPAPVVEGDGTTPVAQQPTVAEVFDPVIAAALGLLDENENVITANFDNAEADLTGTENSAKVFLDVANTNDVKADESATEATQSVQAAEVIAVNVVSAVNGAQTQANALVDTINDQTSDQATIDQAYTDLDNLVNSTNEAVSGQKTAYAEQKAKYNEAIKKLVAFENAYQSALSSSSGAVDKAKANLAKAREDVKKLEDALGEVSYDFDEKELNVAEAEDLVLEARGADWKNQRALLYSILENYIAKDADEGSVEISYTKGFNGQNSSTATLTYSVNGVKITKYYNYDRADRKIYDNDQWKGIGGSKNIIIYQRTEEEVLADLYNLDYYRKLNGRDFTDNEKNGADFKAKVNAGDYDVFAFNSVDEEGKSVTVFKTRDELIKGLVNPESGITQNEDGTFIFGGVAGHKVVQSTLAQDTIIDVQKDEELNAFVGTMERKYAEYNGKITRTKNDIATAETKAKNLKKTINTLQNKNRFVSTYKDKETKELIVTGILKRDLGDFLTDDQIKKIKTVDDAINLLNGLLEKTDAKIEEAELVLKEITDKRDELKEQLYPDVVEEDDDDDDDSSTDTTPSTGDPSYDAGTGTITIPGYDAPIILPSYSPSGVLGVRTDASTDGVGGLQLDGIGDTGNDEKNELKINPIVKKNTVNKNRLGKKISDPAVPLAAIPDVEDDSVTMNWMWLLIIFLLGATGKKMYDEYKKKVEAEEAAKNKDK